MVPPDIVGKTGRALTDVGATGSVEIDGQTFAATTSRAPIPAGGTVTVTGWRLVGEASYVLSVRRPEDDTPLPAGRNEQPAPHEPTHPATHDTAHHQRARFVSLCATELRSLKDAIRWVGGFAALALLGLAGCPPKVLVQTATISSTGFQTEEKAPKPVARLGHSFGWGSETQPKHVSYRVDSNTGSSVSTIREASLATDWPLLVAELALILAAAGLTTVLLLTKPVVTIVGVLSSDNVTERT